MRTTMNIGIFCFLCLVGCRPNNKNQNFDNNSSFSQNNSHVADNKKNPSAIDTINSLNFSILYQFIGKDINVFNSLRFKEGYVYLDTLFESEDGIEWSGLLLKKDGKQVVLFETSWQNPKEISRITLLSDAIMTPDSIRVGDRFREIRGNISPKIPSMPDGYFAVRSKNMSSVLYFLETNERLFYGNVSFDQIPSEQRVINILLE